MAQKRIKWVKAEAVQWLLTQDVRKEILSLSVKNHRLIFLYHLIKKVAFLVPSKYTNLVCHTNQMNASIKSILVLEIRHLYLTNLTSSKPLLTLHFDQHLITLIRLHRQLNHLNLAFTHNQSHLDPFLNSTKSSSIRKAGHLPDTAGQPIP